MFHRWTAWFMLVNAFIHFVCLTLFAVHSKAIAYCWREIKSWNFGYIVMGALVLLALLGLKPIRKYWYQIFYALHKTFYFVFLTGIFRHCWDFGWMPYVYAAIVIHAQERLIRVLKTFCHTALLKLFKHEDDAEDVFKIGVEKKISQTKLEWWSVLGNYFYIRVLTKDLFWQAHLFTFYMMPNTRPESNKKKD
jgi:ferric-chelate reductase